MKAAASEGRRAALLVLGIGLMYAPMLSAPIIYDDAGHVRDNAVFQLPFSAFWRGLISRDYFAFAVERTYQPLVTLFHYFTHNDPLIYRLSGLSIHAVNSFLIYKIAQRFAGRRPALISCLLFASFPAHTELLNFSAFKGHLFAASCTLAVLLSVIDFCAGKVKTSLPLRSVVFLILGLLCKETALAAVLLTYIYIAIFARSELRRLRYLLLTFAAISVSYLWFRFSYLAPPPPFPRIFTYSPVESFAFYVRTLAVPYPLCLERSLPGGPSYLLWLAASLAAFILVRKSRESVFSLLWIPATLLPFLHLISFSNVSPVADRYLYLPAAGFCLLLATSLAHVPRGELVLCALAVLWSGLTLARNLTYRSTRALFEQGASCAPHNPRAQFLLGMICFQEGDYKASRAAYERVLSLTDSPGARAALLDIDRVERSR